MKSSKIEVNINTHNIECRPVKSKLVFGVILTMSTCLNCWYADIGFRYYITGMANTVGSKRIYTLKCP